MQYPRWPAVTLALALCVACSAGPTSPTPSGGQPTPGQTTSASGPTDTGSPTETGLEPTGRPLGTPGPNDLPPLSADEINPPQEPLPDPELDDIFDIQSALGDPGYADQAIVSLLKVLGIGTYHDDGTPITPGAETSDADFFLSESEVRGLIALQIAGLTQDSWIPFSDFRDGLVALGFDISENDLADAYHEAYAEIPDSPIAQLVPYIGVEAPLPPFGAWLLFVDGFVPPNQSSGLIASVGGLPLAPPARGLGNAWQQLQRRLQTPQAQNAFAQSAQNAHIMAMTAKATLSVNAQPYSAHEGHGGTGAPVTVTAQLNTTPPVSPYTGQPIITGCPNALYAGVGVSWQYTQQISDHGSTAIQNATTDGGGQARLIFTPKQEAANGHGYEVRVVGAVTATASRAEIAQKIYCANPAVAAFLGQNVTGSGNILIAWHEPETIHIKATLTGYRATFKIQGSGAEMHGSDEFEGNLVQQEDGSWHGTVTAIASGGWSGHSMLVLAGTGRCTSSWDTRQQLEVFSNSTVNAGEVQLQFFPVTAPSPPVRGGKCGFTRQSANGIQYIPLGDQALGNPGNGQGLEIRIPPRPGGTQDYPWRVILPSGSTTSVAKWHVEITYLGPP